MDFESIVRYCNTVAEVVGPEWLKRKRRKAQSRSGPKKLGQFGVLYEPSIHPLVGWATEYIDEWWPAFLETGTPPLSQPVLKLITLGEALELTRSQRGFHRLVDRLKQIDTFDAAGFEVEVAASYVARGYAVEFIEEGAEKTPDLKVTAEDEAIFWVECKRRDPGTKRDRRVRAIWGKLEKSLLKYLAPRRLNYRIVVKAEVDPEWVDVSYLANTILDAVKAGGIKRGSPRVISEPSQRFDILVEQLSDPDFPIEMNLIELLGIKSLDQGVFGGERKVDGDGRSWFRNPLFIGFKTAIPPDWVSGVGNLLDAARRQLPKNGPGVVWIRIPDVSWKHGVIQPLERVEEILKEKLTGQQNRRVNAVYVMKRVFEQTEMGGVPTLVLRPLVIRICHDNPRTPVPFADSQEREE